MAVVAKPAYDAVILGLGQSGIACARYLLAENRNFAVMDTRADPPGLAELQSLNADVPIVTGRFDAQMLADAEQIILSPGVDPRQPEVRAAAERGQSIIGEIELFAQAVNAPVIAITGSNGKSTVTSMVGEMARCAGKAAAVGGNLSPPALDLLMTEPTADLYVLELSSFQLETTASLAPVVSAVLNLTADHLDRYDDLRAYAAAKARILSNARHAVLNAQDLTVTAMAPAGLPISWFGEQTGDYRLVTREDGDWLCRGQTPLVAVSSLSLLGRHNVQNALAALAIGSAAGFPDAAMITALKTFRGLPHRSEMLGWHAGRLWINDSKATNVGAAVAGIQGLGRPMVLLAGGDGKGQDFAPLAAGLPPETRAAVVYGAAAGALVQALGPHVVVQRVDSLADAVPAALRLSERGDVIALSPACASLDQFNDYQDRGRQFCALVEQVDQDG
ncbi:MAG: UDP-N-acetylmuramoyl-L-alanine--D-glutamate ligase [Gammaproteobacteria bacterium]|nr:UDP-N-acetylmuramoyl-L-alanine--D-glutamate ligase [Gammaproteobacteria bacterium]